MWRRGYNYVSMIGQDNVFASLHQLDIDFPLCPDFRWKDPKRLSMPTITIVNMQMTVVDQIAVATTSMDMGGNKVPVLVANV